jgi:hypothetical protein
LFFFRMTRAFSNSTPLTEPVKSKRCVNPTLLGLKPIG